MHRILEFSCSYTPQDSLDFESYKDNEEVLVVIRDSFAERSYSAVMSLEDEEKLLMMLLQREQGRQK